MDDDILSQGVLFLPTPSARRATGRVLDYIGVEWISTHALREEGDSGRCERSSIPCYFYPRPPRGGRPAALATSIVIAGISTHALREEGDRQPRRSQPRFLDFYPRPPRGGRLGCAGWRSCAASISTHALREEGDLDTPFFWQSSRISTHALREEGDRYRAGYCQPISISTHALREEGDGFLLVEGFLYPNFYPRPPRGGRPLQQSPSGWQPLFLPTPSARRATFALGPHGVQGADISTHALREEGDGYPLSEFSRRT